ncbi:MAG: phosphoribosylglycinamide formyltransferase [Deltaproteobacteria bacterium]|nr:phosphoribosylglycinamide formyltransferase [Deltaproteobacteria bacterium]
MCKIAVLISGRGTNLESIIRSIETGYVKGAKIVVVISDNKDAYGLVRAKKYKIETKILEAKDFSNKKEYEEKLIEILENFNIDLIVLAGFMRVLSSYFVKHFKWRIMNIHPALLPAFAGLQAQRQAVDSGVRFSGCTVHFVTEKVDEGPIIIQAVVPVYVEDTEDTLSQRILQYEHKIYPKAIKMYVEGKLEITENKVKIKDERFDQNVLINPSL